jgi:hypothetical protein
MKRKLFSPVFILCVWSIALRAIVYILLPPAKEMEQYAGTDLLFFSGLTEHFSDYISHITLIPPLSYIINAFVFLIFGIQKALHIRAFLVMVSVMDIVAVLFLFDASKKAGANKTTSFYLLGFFSAALIPFELWREGMFYDQHTILFVSFFAWSLVGFIKKNDSYKNMAWISVAGGLLVAQSAVNSAVVPLSIILIMGFIYVPIKQFRKLSVAIVISLFLPVMLLFLISRKNKMVGEEALTSNKAGPAMMMVVQRSYDYNDAKIRQVIKECGAPEWYLWTYDHASSSVDKATGKADNTFFILSQAFGICFYADSLVGKAGPFGFDFHPLLNHLRQNDSSASFIRLVKQDSADALYKPYRFAGYSYSLAPRWIGIYGDVSKKIYFKNLLKNPSGMLKSFVIHQGIFSIYGPLFPYNTLKDKSETNLLVRAGLKTIPGKIPLDFFFSFLTLVFAVLGWVTYGIILLNIPVSVIRWLKNKEMRNPGSEKNYFFLINIPVILVALVYSCIVGGENDRYFMQITPYIMILATLLPVWYKGIKELARNNIADNISKA